MAGSCEWRRRCAKLSRKGRLARLALAVPALAFFVSIMDYASFSWARDRLQIIPMMWDQKENYAFNGFTLAFALNLPMANVTAPAGYSARRDRRHRRLPGGDRAGREARHHHRDERILLGSDAICPASRSRPIRSRRCATLRSGSMFSPEFGGMTANIEFEALTGFSNAFLPYGSIPYQQYVRRPLPSLATFLKDEGYVTKALHPFGPWFWNRERRLQGFRLRPLPVRGDAAAAGEARAAGLGCAPSPRRSSARPTLTKEPFFFFAVTPARTRSLRAEPLSAMPATRSMRRSANGRRARSLTYAEGIADADAGLKRLIDWATKRKRQTIIAFFGDHLPPLGPVYVETGFMKEPVAAAQERRRPR